MDHLIKVILTVVLPPLGVFVHEGPSGHFFLNILLTVFGFYVLGLIHGLWRILRKG